nr:hypothetical protein [Tanacetum cinerariifolium]
MAAALIVYRDRKLDLKDVWCWRVFVYKEVTRRHLEALELKSGDGVYTSYMGMRSIIFMVSISPEGFLPSILLLVVVIVVMIIGAEVVVTIIGVVVVVDGVSFIIKLSLGIIGFLQMIVFCYRIH